MRARVWVCACALVYWVGARARRVIWGREVVLVLFGPVWVCVGVRGACKFWCVRSEESSVGGLRAASAVRSSRRSAPRQIRTQPGRVVCWHSIVIACDLTVRAVLCCWCCVDFDRLKREASSAVCAVGGWLSLLLRNGMVTLWAAFYLRISLRRAVACWLSLRLFAG